MGNKLGSLLLRKLLGRVPLVADIAPSPHNRGTVDEFLTFVGVWTMLHWGHSLSRQAWGLTMLPPA